jgi:hypothetical protein
LDNLFLRRTERGQRVRAPGLTQQAPEAEHANKLRLEAKQYVMQDHPTGNFRFTKWRNRAPTTAFMPTSCLTSSRF